jgi:hypothetical protein
MDNFIRRGFVESIIRLANQNAGGNMALVSVDENLYDTIVTFAFEKPLREYKNDGKIYETGFLDVAVTLRDPGGDVVT